MDKNIKFPIFFQDFEGFMMMIKSCDTVDGELEVNDVEEQEFGWDSDGNPLKVFLAAKEKIMIELSNQPPEPAKLREAIIGYACRNNEIHFELPEYQVTPEKLLELAEKHFWTNCPTLFKRFKNWLYK